jgi:hypothetical protein
MHGLTKPKLSKNNYTLHEPLLRQTSLQTK